MSISSAIVVLGALLMAGTGDPIQIEPGKQLPQKVTVRVGEKGNERDVTIRYQLFVPKNYKPNGEKLPLLLFLHGLGECSNDDLNRVKIHGPAKIVDTTPDFPFIVISPQCAPPGGDDSKAAKRSSEEVVKLVLAAWSPEELIQLVDHVEKNLKVDRDREYVTGLSMGGYGTWRLAAAYPDRFAAAVPICGGGDPEKMAEPLSHVPIWAFHGAKDNIVPISQTQEMVDAIRQHNGDVKFTIYPDAEHNSWAAAYDNPELYKWLLAHKRRHQ